MPLVKFRTLKPRSTVCSSTCRTWESKTWPALQPHYRATSQAWSQTSSTYSRRDGASPWRRSGSGWKVWDTKDMNRRSRPNLNRLRISGPTFCGVYMVARMSHTQWQLDETRHATGPNFAFHSLLEFHWPISSDFTNVRAKHCWLFLDHGVFELGRVKLKFLDMICEYTSGICTAYHLFFVLYIYHIFLFHTCVNIV